MQVITTFKDKVRYTQIVTIDDIDFNLLIDWNSYDNHRYITMSYLDGTYVEGLVGIKVVANWPLNKLVRDLDFPCGILFALSENDEDPGFDDLKLMWISSEEL